MSAPAPHAAVASGRVAHATWIFAPSPQLAAGGPHPGRHPAGARRDGTGVQRYRSVHGHPAHPQRMRLH